MLCGRTAPLAKARCRGEHEHHERDEHQGDLREHRQEDALNGHGPAPTPAQASLSKCRRRAVPSVQASDIGRVIRTFARDRDVVHVAFAQAGRRDPHEFRARLQILDCRRADIAHCGAQAAGELVQDRRWRARDKAPGLRCLPARASDESLDVLLEVAIGGAARHGPDGAHAAIGFERAAPGRDKPRRGSRRCRRAASRSWRNRRRPRSLWQDRRRYLMPPSAMTGTSALLARPRPQSMMAVSCGTPTPATMRVVQIEPGPIPILMASAPASISALAPSRRRDIAGDERHLVRRHASYAPDLIQHRLRMPMRGIDDDAVDAGIDETSARARSPVSPTVEAAATRKRPSASLQADG